MRFTPATWARVAGAFFAAVFALAGQTASLPHSVLGPRPTPEQAGRTERLHAILTEGWKVTPAEAARLEGELAHNPEDLPSRIRLISYYGQYILNEARVRHVLWLIENHPEAGAFEDAYLVTRISPTGLGTPGNHPADYARAKALWQQQTSRFPRNTKVLCNAATALSSGDPELALQFIGAARRAEPANGEWTRWLAKIYADAIRWSFWDGKSAMTFTGDAEDYRKYLFALPSFMNQRVKKEMESSADAPLVEAVGQALVREVRLLREKGGSASEGSSLITPEIPELTEFGKMLVERARTLLSQ